jgi:hypothetical protein
LIDVAVDGALGFPGASRVEPDDVETLVERHEKVLSECVKRGDRRAARTSEIHEQRTDALLGVERRQARHRDVERGASRPRVIARQRGGGALETVTTVGPVQRRNGSGDCFRLLADERLIVNLETVGC